ncbi:MAG: hypothetical protein CW338_02245 [Clostridiales bacterium]|nr:hypothetical protein [Clostridiales bacterium]
MSTDHGEKAKQLFLEGYNCCQAVFGAFCDETGIPQDTAMRIASSLGGGVGRLREVCGALLGGEMVLGALRGYAAPETGEVKAAHYERVQLLAHRFRDQYGTYVCRELLGISGEEKPVPTPRTKDFYESRPCLRIVENAARLTQQLLEETASAGGEGTDAPETAGENVRAK